MTQPLEGRWLRLMAWAPVVNVFALTCWSRLDRATRFLNLSAMTILGFIVCVMYVLVPSETDTEALWWFQTGYMRAVSHVLPLSVFAAQISFLHLWRFAAPGFASLPESRLRIFAFMLASLREVARRPRPLWHDALFICIPLLALPWWIRVGVRGQTDIAWKAYIPALKDPGRPDAFGFYTRDGPGHEPHWWSSPDAHLRAIRRSDRVRLTYRIGDEGVSPSEPVRVTFTIAEREAVERLHTEAGQFEIEFAFNPSDPAVADIGIEVVPGRHDVRKRLVGIDLVEIEWLTDADSRSPAPSN